MTFQPTPFYTPILPDNAPFTSEQRAWLNGFLAAMLSPGGGAPISLSPAQAAAFLGSDTGAPEADADDGAPWHDPSMPMDERMKLAEGKPLRRRMMAAMAQQDCGQCGTNCEDYSAAIAAGKEERLNLCQPGGKETLRMLKKLAAELDSAAAASAAEAKPAPAAVAAPGHSREHPVPAIFRGRRRLNRGISAKETWHVEFELPEGVTYKAGDSFGVVPENDPGLVGAIMLRLGLAADARDGERLIRDVLIHDKALGMAPDALFTLLAETARDPDEKTRLARMAEGADVDGDLETMDVLAALEKFPSVMPEADAFLSALDPLQPRLYSISSSPKADAVRLTLTVDAVRYDIGSRTRLGCASTFLGGRLEEGASVPVYIQAAHGFGLPEDGSVPIVMVGPGTGIAPFRAFLQERLATSASGGAWLFFGHQHRDSDFFYEDELSGLQSAGALSRLSLAWSRDGDAKTYVQDKMREEGAELFAWLEKGAHFYVCGDAKRMAADVERALIAVVEEHGGRDAAAAKAYVAALKAGGRYQADVY